MRAVADRALAGAGRGSQRGRGRSGLWDEPESDARSGLGPGGAARRGVEFGPERVAGGGNLGADPATGRGATSSAVLGNCEAGSKSKKGLVDEQGKASLIKGVAKDRRISVEDGQMRHGRKSRSVRVDGYKRHVLHESSHWSHPRGGSHASQCC